MRLVKYLMPFLVVAGFITGRAYAQQVGQETVRERRINTIDERPLREFVESKENIDVRQKASNLEISGDVRFEWRSIREKGIALFDCSERKPHEAEDIILDEGELDIEINQGQEPSEFSSFYEVYRFLRGGSHIDSTGLPVSYNDFDVEFNLRIKYAYKDAWAMAHLQFDNPAGVGAGRDCCGEFPVFNRRGSRIRRIVPRDKRFDLKGSGEGGLLTLKRAYMGYNIWADGKHRLDIELGRRKLDDIFTSEIQYGNRFDGILFKYASVITEVADWYCNMGGFLIDERVNHFGYATELGLLNIYDTGLDLRYSYIDWRKRGRNRCFIHDPIGASFQNSQISFSYTFEQTFFGYEVPIEFYGGFLVNHSARRKIFSHKKRKNLGWYGGLYVGNVNEKGDWAFDIEYIVVQAQAVSDWDVKSVGRGNILDESFVDILDERDVLSCERFNLPNIPSSGLRGYYPRRGEANFVGWFFNFLYAFTDNFSLDTIYQFSNEEDRKIGGPHYYSEFKMEAVYTF